MVWQGGFLQVLFGGMIEQERLGGKRHLVETITWTEVSSPVGGTLWGQGTLGGRNQLFGWCLFGGVWWATMKSCDVVPL